MKNSPCHDEVVVYYITKGKTPDSCNILANKIVDGVEEEMGVLQYRYDEKTKELSSISNNSRWTFKLENEKLKGALTHNGSLFRLIEVTRVK